MARIARFKGVSVTTQGGKTKIKIPERSEDDVQIAIMKWAVLQKHNSRPLADYIIHVPNGGYRKSREGAKFRSMGVKAGYPDLMIDVARGGYHGLRIELKRKSGGRTQDNQKDRIDMLNDEGYCALVCKGFGEATHMIKKYMAGALIREASE